MGKKKISELILDSKLYFSGLKKKYVYTMDKFWKKKNQNTKNNKLLEKLKLSIIE